MNVHKLCYCCSVLPEYVESGIVTVNPDTDMAYLNALHTVVPEDDDDLPLPEVTRIPINYCPNCGAVIITYDESIPVPTYTRATVLGGSCNDQSCRFNDRENSACKFQYINDIGCYATSDAAKQSISDLLANVQVGYSEMTTQ